MRRCCRRSNNRLGATKGSLDEHLWHFGCQTRIAAGSCRYTGLLIERAGAGLVLVALWLSWTITITLISTSSTAGSYVSWGKHGCS